MPDELQFDARYRIIEKIGDGSEGSVYLALYLPTEEFRAVKKLKGGGSAERCHELEMMKNLRNLHLPRVIDVLQKEDATYLVMEHVRGESLDRILKESVHFTEEQAQETALQITDALCYLESRDPPVCHLDIKPSNLIRRPDGRIVLVDFGAAWKEKTQRVRMGTDGYAAPEQYAPDKEADIRSDIYALGALLYRMLTGKTWSGFLRGSQIPNCPEDLAAIVSRCLEEDPGMRFQSASSLRQALELRQRSGRRKRLRVRILGALALACPAAALVSLALPASMDLTNDPQWNYESLLEEARVCTENQSRDCYRQAVFMDPGRKDAYLQYLEDAGSDGRFSAREDLFLRDLFHTVGLGSDLTNEELLRKDPEAYGEVAFQTGLVYWYDAPEEDGRHIAAGWFRRAAQMEPYLEDPGRNTWFGEALLYRDLAAARQMAAAGGSGTGDLESMQDYWRIQGDLIESADQIDSPLLRMELYADTLSDISFLGADLARAGIGTQMQRERILRVLRAAEDVHCTKAQEARIRELKEEAEAAAALSLEEGEIREREAKIRESENEV